MFPVCPFHALTGWLCPGCGATRAVTALLHGHLAQAFGLNALFCAVLLPGLVIYLLLAWRRGRWFAVPSVAVYGLVFVSLAFTIARNL